MIRIFFIFSLFNLLIVENANSQDCLYSGYFELVTSAREHRKDEHYKEANKLLKEAFKKNDFPFGYDLHFALRIAEKIGDKVQMEEICIRLAKGGIPFKFFNRYAKHKWYKNFEEHFAEYQRFYTSNFDLELRSTLIKIANLDRETNDQFHEWRTLEYEHSMDTLIAKMTKVSDDFKQMVNKFGFPSERRFGYYYNKGKVDELPTFVLMIHIYQRGELLYLERLNELACNGHLTLSNEKQLRITRGHGNSTGIVQEMEARKKQYRQ